MYRHAHILGLMSVAVASYGVALGSELRTASIMAGLLALAAVTMALLDRRAAKLPAAATASGRVRDTNVQTKRFLMLMMAVGIVVYAGGGGTFASFSAETANTNSQAASGILTMTDTTMNGTVCASASSSSSAITSDNINDLPANQTIGGNPTTGTAGGGLGGCDQVLNLTNIAPGTFAGYGSVSIANTGSIDATKFRMFAPYVNTALSAAIPAFTVNAHLTSPLSTSGAVTSLAVSALANTISSGAEVDLDDGSGHTQSFFASAQALAGATSISVTALTPNFAYPATTTNVKTASITSLSVLKIEGPITSGDTLELDYGGHSQQVVASANSNPLTQSITVTAFAPAWHFPAGTRVTDLSTDGLNGSNQQENIDCFDVRDTTSYSGSIVGTALNFNYGGGTQTAEKDLTTHWITDATNTFTGPLCFNLGFWIQEQTVVAGTAYNYCWYGDGAATTSHPTSNGQCRAPISAAPASFTGATSFLPTTTTEQQLNLASALRGNVGATDEIDLTQLGSVTIKCTANRDAYIGDTSIWIKSCVNKSTLAAADGSSFTVAGGTPTIVDQTTILDLATDTQTLSNFQTKFGANNEMELPAVVKNGTVASPTIPPPANLTTIELGKSGSAGTTDLSSVASAPATRKFFFGVFLPSGTATFQNSLMGLRSTFGIGFHIDQ